MTLRVMRRLYKHLLTFCEIQVPRLRKRYIRLIIAIFIICVAIIIYLIWHYTRKASSLIPPNPEVPLPPSPSILHTFRLGAVCTDGPPCSQIGRDILSKNGSAVDATIAAMFCNGMVNMQSMGLGGGFLMTIYDSKTKQVYTLNAREAAPLKSTRDMFKEDSKASKSGPLAVGVPGELRGYWAAYKRFGKLPWKDLIEPSIKLCEKGYNISTSQYHALEANPAVKNDPLLSELFVDSTSKQFRKPGSLIKPKIFCNTLRIIADKGGDDLYNGTISDMIFEDIKEMGGIITKEDLNLYQAKWVKPIKIQINNNDTLYTVPLPGSGIILGFILNILKGYKFTNESIATINNTITTYHRIIEAFKYAYAKRTELGDIEFLENSNELVENLTSFSYAETIRLSINDSKTFQNPDHYGTKFFGTNNHGTAHISVLAPNGDAVSVTSTVNIYFGAGITSQRTGILLNSGMDDFAIPGVKNYFGLPGSPANEIQPQKRPLSSMCPSIILDKNGKIKVIIGAAGGTKITTSVALVIMRYLWFGQTIKQAVDAPRIHHQMYPMEIQYEYGNLQQVIDGLEKLGHKTNRYRSIGSVVCALVKEFDKILANADFRKGGGVYGID